MNEKASTRRTDGDDEPLVSLVLEAERLDDGFVGRPLSEEVAERFGPVWALEDAPPETTAGDVLACLPDPSGAQRASVVERLARGGTARAELMRLAVELGVQPAFPLAVLEETDRLRAAPGIDDPALQDLTDVPFVTIDNVDSMDLDQALFIERREEGYVVHYALADASYYVRPGSALFAEALRRGSSYYLPGMAVPMLPRGLSEDLVSLNPHVDRRALVFSMTLDAEGACLDTQVFRARIRSYDKLSYVGVQRHYDDADHGALSDEPYTESLDLLAEVGALLRVRARARDVVAFDRVEVEVKQLDRLGYRYMLLASPRLPVESFNEQISLLCNVEGARLLAEHHEDPDMQAVFRVHPAPRDERLAKLARRIDGLVKALDVDRGFWRWKRGKESLADYLDRLHTASNEARLRRAISQQALVTNERSEFSAEPSRHFGIGAPFYARFSSPMREVVGIFTHKELLEQLGLVSPNDRGADETLRDEVIEAANDAKALQRKLGKSANKLVLDELFTTDLRTEPRPQRRGTVVGIRKTRFYVLLDAPPVEVKVDLDFVEERTGHSWVPRREHALLVVDGDDDAPTVHLGDCVTLEVHEQTRRGRWLFRVLELEAE